MKFCVLQNLKHLYLYTSHSFDRCNILSCVIFFSTVAENLHFAQNSHKFENCIAVEFGESLDFPSLHIGECTLCTFSSSSLLKSFCTKFVDKPTTSSQNFCLTFLVDVQLWRRLKVRKTLLLVPKRQSRVVNFVRLSSYCGKYIGLSHKYSNTQIVANILVLCRTNTSQVLQTK